MQEEARAQAEALTNPSEQLNKLPYSLTPDIMEKAKPILLNPKMPQYAKLVQLQLNMPYVKWNRDKLGIALPAGAVRGVFRRVNRFLHEVVTPHLV